MKYKWPFLIIHCQGCAEETGQKRGGETLVYLMLGEEQRHSRHLRRAYRLGRRGMYCRRLDRIVGAVRELSEIWLEAVQLLSAAGYQRARLCRILWPKSRTRASLTLSLCTPRCQKISEYDLHTPDQKTSFIFYDPTLIRWQIPLFSTIRNLSLKCSLGFSPPPVDPIWGPFLAEKE